MKILPHTPLMYGTDAKRLAYTPLQIYALYYTTDTNKYYIWSGSVWVLINGSGTGSMEIHGNEYHDPDYVTQANIDTSINSHKSVTQSVHNFDSSGNAPAQTHGNEKHNPAMEPANANIQTHVTSAHAPSNAQKNSDITKAEIEAKLTGEISTHTHAGGGSPIGYTINVQALTSSPVDAQTVYFGTLPKAPVTVAATSKVFIRKAGTIKIAEIYCYSGTAGTNQAWSLYIRKNNTTDYLIATLSVATNERVFTNSSLSIAMAAGDYFEIKGVQPTWTTNPLTTIYGGYVYVE